LSSGIDSGGGLAVSADGLTLFAGVTLSDKSKGIISTSTAPAASGENEWTRVAQTEHKPNGMAADWATGTLYCTTEGYASGDGGVFTVNVASGESAILTEAIPGADGAWFDPANSILYVGQLLTLKVWVYDAKNGVDMGFFDGAASLKSNEMGHMLDDITLHPNGTNKENIGKTLFYGADFTASQIISFSLDGSFLEAVPFEENMDPLLTPTSVRFGKGPGFCSQSLYVTEGGGLAERQTGRRVLQMHV
jgi:hypothetical protein